MQRTWLTLQTSSPECHFIEMCEGPGRAQTWCSCKGRR